MRKLLVFFAALVALGATVAYLAATTYLTPERLRDEILTRVQAVFSGRAVVRSAAFGAPANLTVEGLELLSPDGYESFLAIRKATVSLDLWAIVRGKIRLSEIAIDGLSTHLTRAVDGRFTFERYLGPARRACGGRPAGMRFYADPLAGDPRVLAAGVATDSTTGDGPSGTLPFEIHRIFVRAGELNYLDQNLPLKVGGVAGSMSLTNDCLEILELRGRAFDQFVLSVRGTIGVPSGTTDLTVKLDESALKPLISFIPKLSMALTWAREQLKGLISVTAQLKKDEHSESTSVRAGFRDLEWTSPTLVGGTIQGAEGLVEAMIRPAGAGVRVEGGLRMAGGAVRPNFLTTDIALPRFSVAFEATGPFVRIKSFDAVFRHGNLSGSGFCSFPWPRPPDYELSFALSNVPFDDLGLQAGGTFLSRASVAAAKGRVIPNAVVLNTLDVQCGASRLGASGSLRPEGVVWALKDTQVGLDIDGPELGGLLGLAGAAQITGRMKATFGPTGPMRSFRASGRVDRCQLSVANPSGGPANPVEIEGGTFELVDARLATSEFRGRVFGGPFAAQITQAEPTDAAGGCRVAIELRDAQLPGLAAALGFGDVVKSGTVRLSGRLAGTTLAAGLAADRVVTAVVGPLREAASRLSLTAFEFTQLTARALLTPQRLSLIDLKATGPACSLAGSAHIEGGGRSGGSLLVTSPKDPKPIPVVFGALDSPARKN